MLDTMRKGHIVGQNSVEHIVQGQVLFLESKSWSSGLQTGLNSPDNPESRTKKLKLSTLKKKKKKAKQTKAGINFRQELKQILKSLCTTWWHFPKVFTKDC